MAEVEAQAPPPALQEEEVQSEGSGPVDAHPETDGEHEATDVVEASTEPEHSEAEPAESVNGDKPDENGVEERPGENGATDEEHSAAPAEEMPKENATVSPPASPAKKITAKSSISVRPPPGKPAGGPPTPLVKQVRGICTWLRARPPTHITRAQCCLRAAA